MTSAVCPACVAVPHDRIDKTVKALHSFYLSVPTVYCAGCIGKIERGLKTLDGVVDARVNLSLKRLHVKFSGN